MLSIFPKTNYSKEGKIIKEECMLYLESKFIGRNSFIVNPIIGVSEITYIGELENGQIILDRVNNFTFKLQPYPTTTIKIEGKNEDSLIHINIELSIYWKIFIASVYILIVIAAFINLFKVNQPNQMLMLIKFMSGLLVIIIFTLLFHFNEKKNIENIFNKLDI